MAVLLSAIIACSTETQVREVEVTREVPVTQEVPVTVETVKTVEVTHEVPVTQEIPVTVETIKTVEVTREVETVKTVEVTREVPITRLASATPTAPTPATSTTSGEPTTTTPVPTATPVPTITPTRSPQSPFGSWRMEQTNYGERELSSFRNTAVAHETGDLAPTLIYQCDTRGNRALRINWRLPLATEGYNIRRQSDDNRYDLYQDVDLDALVKYADVLYEFVNDLQLTESEQRELDEAWDDVRSQWRRHPKPPTADLLIELLRIRSHRSVEIDLDFFVTTANQDQQNKHRPPILDTISSRWIVLSEHHTQINPSGIGELRPTYLQIRSSASLTEAPLEMMTATMQEPEQPATVAAKWEISGLGSIMNHCKSIRPR